jgi:hypothetical protein
MMGHLVQFIVQPEQGVTGLQKFIPEADRFLHLLAVLVQISKQKAVDPIGEA